jgi:hypothetical protein
VGSPAGACPLHASGASVEWSAIGMTTQMSDDRMFVPSQALNAPIFSENFPSPSRSSKPS